MVAGKQLHYQVEVVRYLNNFHVNCQPVWTLFQFRKSLIYTLYQRCCVGNEWDM